MRLELPLESHSTITDRNLQEMKMLSSDLWRLAMEYIRSRSLPSGATTKHIVDGSPESASLSISRINGHASIELEIRTPTHPIIIKLKMAHGIEISFDGTKIKFHDRRIHQCPFASLSVQAQQKVIEDLIKFREFFQRKNREKYAVERGRILELLRATHRSFPDTQPDTDTVITA